MRLFELDPNNPIDKKLMKTSQDVERNGSLDQNDIDAVSEPADMDQDGIPDIQDEEKPEKPIDDGLMAKIRNHDYLTDYEHDKNKSSDPMRIANLDMQGLTNLRNKIRAELDRVSLIDRVGAYDDPKVKTMQDMLSFVDVIMGYKKKHATSAGGSVPNNPPKPRVERPKHKAGPVKMTQRK